MDFVEVFSQIENLSQRLKTMKKEIEICSMKNNN